MCALTQPVLFEGCPGPPDRRVQVSCVLRRCRKALEHIDKTFAVAVLGVERPLVRQVRQQRTARQGTRRFQRGRVAGLDEAIELFHVDRPWQVIGDADARPIGSEVGTTADLFQRHADRPQGTPQRRACAGLEHVRPKAARQARSRMHPRVQQQVRQERTRAKSLDGRNRAVVHPRCEITEQLGAEQHGQGSLASRRPEDNALGRRHRCPRAPDGHVRP